MDEYRIRTAEWVPSPRPTPDRADPAEFSAGGIGSNRWTEAEFRGTRHKQLLDNDLLKAARMLWAHVETRKWTKSATDYWKTICDVDKMALLDEVLGVSYIRRA